MNLITPPPADAARATFTGRPGRFLRLLVRGSLLQIPTFGFYRFWYLTDMRRHLWSNTRLGGEPLEYTGTARELLIGFLIALAVLVPIYFGYFLLGLAAESARTFGSIPLLLLLSALGLYAAYRARRYQATRTAFRGLRLWMRGSGWAYMRRALLWNLATLLTLGLAYPWRSAALERYMMRHTSFGDLPGSFEGTGLDLLRRGWWIWALAVVLLGLPLAGVGFALQQHDFPAEGQQMAPQLATAFGLLLLALPALFLILPLLRAVELRWWLDGLRFGPLRFASDLKKRRVVWLYVKAALWSFLLFLGVFTLPLVAGMFYLFSLPEAQQPDPASFSLAAAIAVLPLYLLLFLGLDVIRRFFLTRGFWAAAVASVTVLNVAALDGVVAGGSASDPLDAGFADALDVGGF